MTGGKAAVAVAVFGLYRERRIAIEYGGTGG
jgi:hypothetical protein